MRAKETNAWLFLCRARLVDARIDASDKVDVRFEPVLEEELIIGVLPELKLGQRVAVLALVRESVEQ